MTRAVDFTLDDHVVAVMAMYKKSQDRSDEEKDDVHDSESPACLEHGALTVDVQIVSIPGNAENTKVGTVLAVAADVCAVCICDASKLIHSSDEGSNEEQVDECNEVGRVTCTRIEEKRA